MLVFYLPLIMEEYKDDDELFWDYAEGGSWSSEDA